MIILMNLNALQRTSCERMKSDFSYALRNVYVGDALAIFEGPGPDFLNKVRYRRGFQASTSLERTPYNLFHAVWKDDVLKRCAAVEGMHGYLLNAIGQDDLSKTGTIRECAYTSILQRAGKFYPLKGLTSAESAFINLSQCGGKLTLLRFLHPSNADSAIVVTPDGITILLSSSQSLNAYFATRFSLFGITAFP